MVWEHISRCYFTDLELGLHQLPKLTLDHINLTSFAKMKVNLVISLLRARNKDITSFILKLNDVIYTRYRVLFVMVSWRYRRYCIIGLIGVIDVNWRYRR